jgi:hypothetical protein
MLRKTLTTALICSSSLLIGACRNEQTSAVLAAGFADEDPQVSTVTLPPAEWGEYSMQFPLLRNDRVCLLTGRIPDKKIMILFDACEGITGTGKISCNDGRVLDVQWSMASCRSGHGRSIGPASPGFFFGFGLTEENALSQHKAARQAR